MNRYKPQIVNLLTYSRLICIPFIFLIENKWLLAIYTMIFFWTDFLDGYLARRWEVTSTKGALLDLIADKSLVIVLFSAMAFRGMIQWWIVFLIAFREIASMVIREINLRTKKKLIKANMIGKTKTTLQFLALSMLILEVPGSIMIGWSWQTNGADMVSLTLPIYLVVVYAMLVVSYVSFYMYLKEFFEK